MMTNPPELLKIINAEDSEQRSAQLRDFWGGVDLNDCGIANNYATETLYADGGHFSVEFNHVKTSKGYYLIGCDFSTNTSAYGYAPGVEQSFLIDNYQDAIDYVRTAAVKFMADYSECSSSCVTSGSKDKARKAIEHLTVSQAQPALL